MGRGRERGGVDTLYALIQFFESAMSFYWDPGNMPVLGRVIWPGKGSRKVPFAGCI
jgi:hypothetical protein